MREREAEGGRIAVTVSVTVSVTVTVSSVDRVVMMDAQCVQGETETETKRRIDKKYCCISPHPPLLRIPPSFPPPPPTAPPSPEFTLNLDEDEEYEGEEGDYDEVSGVKHFNYIPH